MAKIIGLAALVVLIELGSARAGGYPLFDELTRYAERIDTLSVTSGDAEDVNAATQIIDPWPAYARDRRIPTNGQRMVGAINRYQNPSLLGAQAPTLAPVIQPGGSGGGQEGGAGGGAVGGQ
jgi:hypothetical protein